MKMTEIPEEEEELEELDIQCVNCWHRWRLRGYAPIEFCPKCGSIWQVYVKAINESLKDEEIDAPDILEVQAGIPS